MSLLMASASQGNLLVHTEAFLGAHPYIWREGNHKPNLCL